MAMHMEHPGSRHSQPAARKTSGNPSAIACRFTSCDPGTTSTRTLGLTLRPFSTEAAARRSEMRELVQLPMNTTSMGNPASGLPPSRPIYLSAFAMESRCMGSETRDGSGTGWVMGTPIPGLLQEALRCQHVFHLAGADAERQRAECAVSGGMAIAAGDRHAGLGQAQFGSDNVYDPLPCLLY